MLLNSFNKQWIGTGLIILMLLKAWVIPLICLDYELRKEYISKNLCMNRNRPMLNCNGKCYLARKIAETKKQEEQKAEQDYLASLIYQVMDSREEFRFITPQTVFESRAKPAFHYTSPFAPRFTGDDIFHPPLV